MRRTLSGILRRVFRVTVDPGPLRRHRDFRLLFAGQGISFFGSMITSVAVPYQVYGLTHSSLAVGIIGACEITAILALAFLGGALADANDRRRMVQVTEIGLLLTSALLLANTVLGHPRLWALYVLATLLTGLDALQRPSLDALLPRMVDRDEILPAAAILSLRSTVGMIAGPALGGVLIATVGLASTYAVDVGTFFVSLVCLRLMKAVPPPVDAERPSVRRVLEGLRYARSRPELMGTYLVDMVAMFFGMPMALFPAMAAKYGGAGVLGALYSAPAVGSFIASGTSGWSRHVHHHGRAVILAAFSWGVAIVFFGLAPSLPLALFFLAAAGGADMLSGVFRSAIWNQTIPDSLRGRLASIELISYSSGPTLGNLESGAAASLFGVPFAVVSGGALCAVGVVALAAALRGFWSYDARSSVAAMGSREAGEEPIPAGRR